MSIAPPVGGLSAYLARIVSSREFLSVWDIVRRLARKLTKSLHVAARKTEEFATGLATGGTLFVDLAFFYVGSVDGNNLDHLITVHENVRDAGTGSGPIQLV